MLTLYAGKKVGDLALSWVSQEQGDVQLIGYIEGAPPAPMANMTDKPPSSYLGATSVTFNTPTSVTLKYNQGYDSSDETKWDYNISTGIQVGLNAHLSPLGFGVAFAKGAVFELDVGAGSGPANTANLTDNAWSKTPTEKLDESNKYTVKLQGTAAPYTGDQFMASLNTLTTPSTTAGNPSSKTADPAQSEPGRLHHLQPARRAAKGPDRGEVRRSHVRPVPVWAGLRHFADARRLSADIVADQHRLRFRSHPGDSDPTRSEHRFLPDEQQIPPAGRASMASIGYVYNPATLPTGARTYTTSTGQMVVLYDENFSPGEVGHDASYMRVVEAYKLKKQIDQLAFNTLALYQTAYGTKGGPN